MIPYADIQEKYKSKTLLCIEGLDSHVIQAQVGAGLETSQFLQYIGGIYGFDWS